MVNGTLRILASVWASSVLPEPGGAEQQDVRLPQLDVVRSDLGLDALVVVVDRDREDLLGALLADDVLVEDGLDLGRLGHGAPGRAVGSFSISSAMMSLQSPMHSSQM